MEREKGKERAGESKKVGRKGQITSAPKASEVRLMVLP